MGPFSFALPLCVPRIFLRAQQFTCPSGHSLKPFQVDTRTYTCDVCAGAQQLQATMLGCRVCDYDVCMSCAKLHADLKTRALLEAEQQRREEEVRVPV